MENRIYECDGIIHYYGSPAGVVKDSVAVIDAIFDKKDLNEFIENELHCSISVKDGIYDTFFSDSSPVNKSMEELIQKPDNGMFLKIYQLTAEAPDEIRFATMEQRTDRGYGHPVQSEYKLVYEEPISEIISNEYLEKRLLALKDKIPGGAAGHPLDVSDVIELTDGENSKFLYQNRTKYEEIEFV